MTIIHLTTTPLPHWGRLLLIIAQVVARRISPVPSTFHLSPSLTSPNTKSYDEISTRIKSQFYYIHLLLPYALSPSVAVGSESMEASKTKINRTTPRELDIKHRTDVTVGARLSQMHKMLPSRHTRRCYANFCCKIMLNRWRVARDGSLRDLTVLRVVTALYSNAFTKTNNKLAEIYLGVSPSYLFFGRGT